MKSVLMTLLAATALGTATLAAPALAQDGRPVHAVQHADFDSGRFHVRIDGPDAPLGDVILIPGLSSSPHVWDMLTDELKGRYRVHRVHVQGFAGAPAKDNGEGPVAAPVAEDIARYIAEQGLSKPAVIGHSMGGTIGMMLAARHPDAVGRLMVVDMIPFMGAMFAQPGVDPTVAAITPMVEAITAQAAVAADEAYRAQAAAAVISMIKTESLRERPLQDAARSDRVTSQNAYKELLLTDLRPELARITAPVAVMYVAFEFPGMTAEMTDGIYRGSFATLPSARLTRIDDSAHFIMLDQPTRFAAEVNAFLE